MKCFFPQNSNISVRLHSLTFVLEARQLRRILKSMQTAAKKMHGRMTLATLFLWTKCYLWTNLMICSSICLADFKHVCVLCFRTTYLKAVIYFCEKAPPLILDRFLDIPLATLHGMKWLRKNKYAREICWMYSNLTITKLKWCHLTPFLCLYC